MAVAATALPVVPLAKVAYAEPEAPAHYEFQYSVHDEHSGDIKQQHEARAGDALQGSYSLVQPDGVHRIVDYTADEEHGFNAIVRYEGHPSAAPAKIAYAAAPVAYAAPKFAYAPVAKVAYAAPVAKVAYSSPLTQFFVLFSLAVAATALPVVPLAKVAYAEPEAPAHYEFQYSVHDEHSGDIKQQHEARAGDALQGSYSLVQPDGVHRIVDYTADEEHGFNAIVRYEGHPSAAPAKIAYAAAPVAYAAPKFAYAPVAKVAYAAPVAKVAYSSPLTQFFVLISLAVAATALPVVPLAKVAYAEPEAPAHYEFQYSVHDEHSGDIKQQHEARAGDALQGSYSLVQPDGVHRIVDYTADEEHGFNAIVRYEGHPSAAPAKIAYASAPVAYAAPKFAYAPAAKVAYAAPVAKVAYSSPLTQVTFSSPAISYHH
ncbi:unnamed protein product [Parnassius mnemosyne]|uniref:Cuticle protein n=1 Tax=Parnassius mnemosyne TaxID=213953 RepID=A0AAV1KCQ4_9NEOP